MVKVVVTYIIDAKIINNEYKHNGAPFVVPKPSHPYKESVVECTGIVQDRAYNTLYAFYTPLVEFGACVFFCQ